MTVYGAGVTENPSEVNPTRNPSETSPAWDPMDGELAPDEQVAEAYIELRGRVIELLGQLDEVDGDRAVPACPGWTVRQLIAHMVGVPEDVLAGRIDGLATDAWTQAQVDRHAGETLADLRHTLGGLAAEFDPVLRMVPAPMNSQFVMDAVTHEHDLREAVGRPGAQDSSAVEVALAWLLRFFRLPAEASAQLAASGAPGFTVMRAMSGRMSVEAMNAAGLPGEEIARSLAGSPLVPPIR